MKVVRKAGGENGKAGMRGQRSGWRKRQRLTKGLEIPKGKGKPQKGLKLGCAHGQVFILESTLWLQEWRMDWRARLEAERPGRGCYSRRF